MRRRPAVGAAYSLPPLRLKRFPALASLSITLRARVVVNLGVALHFSHALGGGRAGLPGPVWALTLFVLPFSFAIAILKDVPDLEGDRALPHRARSPCASAAGACCGIGLAALTLAYLGMAVLGPLLLAASSRSCWSVGHLLALAAPVALGARGRRGGPRGLHALLHARLDAVLPRVCAGRAGVRGGLTRSSGWGVAATGDRVGPPRPRGHQDSALGRGDRPWCRRGRSLRRGRVGEVTAARNRFAPPGETRHVAHVCAHRKRGGG